MRKNIVGTAVLAAGGALALVAPARASVNAGTDVGWERDFRSLPFDESGEKLLLGIGCGIALSPTWPLALQYEDFGSDVESASLAVSYRFGG